MPAPPMSVTDALRNRTSIRDFLDTPVEESLVREILDIARWSPSGGNLQPWEVVVVAGAAREAVVALAQKALADGALDEGAYPIYPPSLWEPYRTRRFALGEQMYAHLGIPREDRAGRLARFARNYEFFGAPVALFFVIEKAMGHGQWAHLGMFMQSVALAAFERGVSSCMQEAWGPLRSVLGPHFDLPETEVVYCGMALGFRKPDSPVNRLRSDRAPVEQFSVFLGF